MSVLLGPGCRAGSEFAVGRIVEIARRVAAASPEAMLACPVCGVVLKSANLERHLAGVHQGDEDAGASWRGRGWKGGSLSWHDDTLRWRSRSGLRRRSVGPVQAVLVGSTVSSRTEYTSMTTHPDHGGSTVLERSGAYVMVCGNGRQITVRCRAGGSFRKAWAGWDSGSRVKSWHITIDPDAFVALSYLMVDAGVLRPRSG